jgi:isochorismate pyruvate lyase
LNPLTILRDEIDAVDVDLVALIQKRFEIIDRIIEVKRANGIAVALPDRIEQVMQNALVNAKHSNVPPQTIENLWRGLIAETLAYEHKILSVE